MAEPKDTIVRDNPILPASVKVSRAIRAFGSALAGRLKIGVLMRRNEILTSGTYSSGLPYSVLADQNISSNAKIIFMILLNRLGENEYVWPSHTLLQKESGLTRGSVSRAKIELIDAGYLLVSRKHNCSNRYTLNLPSVASHGRDTKDLVGCPTDGTPVSHGRDRVSHGRDSSVPRTGGELPKGTPEGNSRREPPHFSGGEETNHIIDREVLTQESIKIQPTTHDNELAERFCQKLTIDKHIWQGKIAKCISIWRRKHKITLTQQSIDKLSNFPARSNPLDWFRQVENVVGEKLPLWRVELDSAANNSSQVAGLTDVLYLIDSWLKAGMNGIYDRFRLANQHQFVVQKIKSRLQLTDDNWRAYVDEALNKRLNWRGAVADNPACQTFDWMLKTRPEGGEEISNLERIFQGKYDKSFVEQPASAGQAALHFGAKGDVKFLWGGDKKNG